MLDDLDLLLQVPMKNDMINVDVTKPYASGDKKCYVSDDFIEKLRVRIDFRHIFSFINTGVLMERKTLKWY